MAELFRYIEQGFAVPESGADAIDVAQESDFQHALQDAAGQGADALRSLAERFLAEASVDGMPADMAAQFVALGTRLRAHAEPTPDAVASDVATVFDASPGEVVQSNWFREGSAQVNDLLVAIKLTTAFDRLDAPSLVATRRVMSFLSAFVAGDVAVLSAAAIRQRLARPIRVPQALLPPPSSRTRPAPDPPSPDPAAERREALLAEQAVLSEAYETLMRLHPSQLEIRATAPAVRKSSRQRNADTGRNDDDHASMSTPSLIAVPPQTLAAFDARVRRVVESQLTPATASFGNVVDVVRRRWLDVSQEVEPYKVPQPARIYRVGLHLFALSDPAPLAAKIVAPPTEDAPDFSHAITRPVGIGNLQVVRQELVGYEAAEVSHIENVMPGELMRRVVFREETNELMLTEETTTTKSEERDQQSTQRNELSTEAQKEASQQSVATQDQTTTTNYGRLVENSKSNYARSVTDRAVNTLTQMVRTERVQREKRVFSDRAVHELDNKTGSAGVRGIYQWVDKKYKARLLNYGKRLLYDVVVPEPAAYLIGALKTAAQPENFQLQRPSAPWITPAGLNASNYMTWAAQYGVTGAVSPPPDDFVTTFSHPDVQNVDKKVDAYGGSFPAQVYQAFQIQIPEHYKAVSGYIQMTNRRMAGASPSGRLEFFVGEHYYFRFEVNDPLNRTFAMNGESGAIPVTVNSTPQTLQFNYAVAINCRRTDKTLEQWQLKTHAAIVAGYQRQRAEYLDQLGRYQSAVRSQMAAARTLGRDASVERQELKKAFIHLLMSEHFSQVSIPTPNPLLVPPDPLHIKKWGAVVAFFERAFEWENLMYAYYPYFWGRSSRWAEMVLTQDTDPDFEAFLRAGAARVVVPARPGFEAALAHYHETGDVWMGEEIPDMFGDLYVSIIAEIKARNAAPNEEICLAEWDVRLPTTLVMLKDDATLPAWTPAKPCVPPPEV